MVDIWKILDIAPTEDEKAIRVAYAQKLKTIHAGDDPEAFQLLRKAYEAALAKDYSEVRSRVTKKKERSKATASPSTPTFKLRKEPEQKREVPVLLQQVKAMVTEFFADPNVFYKWVNEKVFSRLDLSGAFQEAILAEWVSQEEIDKVLFLYAYQHFNWGTLALKTGHPFIPSICEIVLGHEMSTATEYLDQNGLEERHPLRLCALVNDADRAEQCDDSELNDCDAQGNTPLHLACEVCAEEMVKHLIKRGADLEKINSQGLTPLIIAVLKGSEEICDLLCKAGADINFITENGFSVLNFAAAHSSVGIVDVLCRSENLKVDSKALAAAVQQNNLEMVKKLVQLGCDLDDERGKQFATPLAIAVRYHFDDIAEFLIEHGADVNAGGVLSLAAVRGSYKIAKKLIESGATINKCWDQSSLHYALEYGHFSIADLLFHSLNLTSKDAVQRDNADDISTYIRGAVEAGTMGYPSLWDEKFLRYGMGSVMTIAHDAFYYSPMIKFVHKRDIPGLKYTLKAKPDQINKADKTYGVTPLYLACQEGYLDCVELLLASGADLNQINTNNCLGPLHIAIMNHHNAIVQILLDHGADINLTTPPTQYSPLLVAVHAQNAFAYKALLDLDAKDPPSGFCHSALMAACYRGSMDMVKALVERGSDIKQCVNDRYRSLVYIAARYGHVDVLNYLLEQGLHPDWIQEEAVSLNYDSFKHRNIPFTALSAAVVNVDVQSVRLLLGAGADPNRFSPNGKPPLHFAYTHPEMVDLDDRLMKLEEIIKLLIAHGGDINIQAEDGDTFLMKMVREECLLNVIQLIEIGADLAIPDSKGFTPYQIALKSKNGHIIQALQKAGAELIDIKASLAKQQLHV
ncbi:MAG: ankyrin repeat domain-containing protein [Chlamydiia bacterium]|nr:ankyrin repeat domain-containing protein [Chlamydiia bacterium]